MVRYLALIVAMLFLFSCDNDENNNADEVKEESFFIKAVDVSSIPEIRNSGITVYNASGESEDMLTTLKNAGVNTIRLRLWKNPENGHSGFEEVKLFANEIKSKGMKVWLTVHYSDTWADPAMQTKPAEWQNLSYTELQENVYSYTTTIITQIQPDYIQIGNEINGGFLWPEGSWENPEQFRTLLSKGISAVRDNSDNCKIILHYAGYEYAQEFYQSLNDLDYDIAGLSYYPIWHGKNLNTLKSTLQNIANQYNKKVVLAETAYPFTLGWNDHTNNIVGAENQILPQFTASQQGQKQYLQTIKQLVSNIPEGLGFCYWGAELIAFRGETATNGSTTENMAFWDFDEKALPVLEVYTEE